MRSWVTLLAPPMLTGWGASAGARLEVHDEGNLLQGRTLVTNLFRQHFSKVVAMLVIVNSTAWTGHRLTRINIVGTYLPTLAQGDRLQACLQASWNCGKVQVVH